MFFRKSIIILMKYITPMKKMNEKPVRSDAAAARDISQIISTSYLTAQTDVVSQFIDSMMIEIVAQNAYRYIHAQKEIYEFFSALFIFVYIESGSCEITADSRKHVSGAGDLLLFLPYQTYDICILGTKSFSFKYISFDIIPFTHKRRFQQMMIYCRQTVLDMPAFDTYKIMFRELFEEKEVHSIGHGCTLRLYLEQLIIEIFRNENLSDVAREYLQTNASADRIVNESAIYMDSHLSDPIDIVALSRSLGVSKTTLYNAFIEVMNIPPIKFFTIYKMKMASQMLKKSMSMKKIAEKLGYSSVPHLSKTFKSVFGCAPSVWKSRISSS